MSKRIPEPWAEDQYHQVIVKDDQVICTRGFTFNPLTTEEESGMNTQRIIRCVNACEGFSTEELKGMNLFNASIESINEIINLTDERDELLNILQRLEAVDFGKHWSSDAEQAAIAARELIRKFEVESRE